MRRDEHFRVDASLMQQLGASLIKDDFSALVELIKNAYDADATQVNVIIDAPDTIVVSDNGHGMDQQAIVRGWLTISNSLKMEQKQKGVLTSKQKRTPLGDKGLGRLSTQRLGKKLRIDTVVENSSEKSSVEINWANFIPGQDLATIPVVMITSDIEEGKAGTRLTISDLLQPMDWLKMSKADLQIELASLVSPYSEIANFRLRAFLNGEEVSPDALARNIRGAAWQSFNIKFDGNVFTGFGKVRMQTFRGNTNKSKDEYKQFMELDGGTNYLKYLLEKSHSEKLGISRSKDPTYLLEFSYSRTFEDIIGKSQLDNPGPFMGELDAFSLDNTGAEDIMKGTDVLSNAKTAKNLVKDLSGIKVFRDGFVVKTEHDWLRLGQGQTSGGSFYGLRPFNTMGYIAITAEGNKLLRETTDRESFIEDSYYQGFFAILSDFINRYSQTIEHMRRTWLEYVDSEQKKELRIVGMSTVAIENRISDAFNQVKNANEKLDEASNAINDIVNEESPSLFLDKDTALKISYVKELVDQSTQVLSDVNIQSGLSAFLTKEVTMLEERLDQVYELVSLGITAEALSHDISVILDRIRDETASIAKYLKTVKSDDFEILRYVESIRSSISGLERQLGHLDPALKYVRDKTEIFRIGDFTSDCARYYHDRLGKNDIAVKVDILSEFTVRMNKGKLIQVLDNLVFNSEYWLINTVNSTISKGIRITIEEPNVIVEDNGPGVEELFSQSLFEPFITAKPSQEGRGLGLFIATQLLEIDGCTLKLLPDLNERGRRYRFEIGLGGVLA